MIPRNDRGEILCIDCGGVIETTHAAYFYLNGAVHQCCFHRKLNARVRPDLQGPNYQEEELLCGEI